MDSFLIVCMTLHAIAFCPMNENQFDNTKVKTVVTEYQNKYMDLDEPEEGSTRQHIVRRRKYGN